MAVIGQSGKFRGQSFNYGTGGRLYTHAEFAKLHKSGQMEISPVLLEWQRRVERETLLKAGDTEASVPHRGGQRSLPQAKDAVRTPLIVRNKIDDEWDRYTREFIERYKLNDAQASAARRILENCKDQRTRFLRSRKTQIAQLESRMARKNSSTKSKSLVVELDKLRERVRAIFEEQLKPRLDKLTTRTQRKAVESKPDKKP